MTTSPTSYLQTLPKDEAIAFVASLQKVKRHLSQELAWLSQQVQQKTVQLQGIETLLLEAAVLGLVNGADAANAAVESTVATDASTMAAIADRATDGSGAVALPVTAVPGSKVPGNGNTAPTTPTAATVSDVAPPPPAKTSARGKRGALPVSKKSAASKAKPTSSSKAGQRKANPPAKESTQAFVKSQFQDQSITDAIGDILKRSRSPLSADDIMTILYEGLSDEAYKRAKNSVTNILSVGRGKGKWKSTGRGLYANNAVGA